MKARSVPERFGVVYAATVLIYELRDPSTGRPRYVGATRRVHIDSALDLRRRLYGHCCADKKRSLTKAWIADLRGHGLRPTIHLLAEVPAQDAMLSEYRWMEYLRARGERLLNCNVPSRHVLHSGPRPRQKPRSRYGRRETYDSPIAQWRFPLKVFTLSAE